MVVVIGGVGAARDGILKQLFLVEVSGHKLESSQARVLIRFSTLIFPLYKMLFMNIVELRGFFVRIFKPEKSIVIFKNRQ